MSLIASHAGDARQVVEGVWPLSPPAGIGGHYGAGHQATGRVAAQGNGVAPQSRKVKDDTGHGEENPERDQATLRVSRMFTLRSLANRCQACSGARASSRS